MGPLDVCRLCCIRCLENDGDTTDGNEATLDNEKKKELESDILGGKNHLRHCCFGSKQGRQSTHPEQDR